jgi:hypothetical protein
LMKDITLLVILLASSLNPWCASWKTVYFSQPALPW